MYGAGLLDTDGDAGEVVILKEELTALKGENSKCWGRGDYRRYLWALVNKIREREKIK